MSRIAINGFGRIGRLFLRQAFASRASFEIVAINDLGSAENLAYLLRYDSVYGRFPGTVAVRPAAGPGAQSTLVVNGLEIVFLQEKDIAALPWKKMNVDVVVESTGIFETYEKAGAHLQAGARRVVLSAPAKDADGPAGQTVLIGINNGAMQARPVTSNGSCTTNATAPVIEIMAGNPGVEKAVLNTVHAFTATQNLVDGPVKGSDLRRGRAAPGNMAPSSTGAALSVTRAIQGLSGKFDGIAVRVPVAAGSLADITFIAKRNTSVEEIQQILVAAAASPRWQGIIKIADGPVVSSDIVGEPYAAIIDLEFVKVIDGNLVKVLAWYDNEWGYVSTLVKHVSAAAMLV